MTTGTPTQTETVNLYGGGNLNYSTTDSSFLDTAGPASLLSQVEHVGFSGGSPALLTIDETIYVPDGLVPHGNKPLLERSLGASVNGGGGPVSCSLPGGDPCASDVDCGSNISVSSGQVIGQVCGLEPTPVCVTAAPASPSDDPRVAYGALCRGGFCRSVLTSTTYTYTDRAEMHTVSSSRVYGDTNSNLPPDVQTTTTTLTSTGQTGPNGETLQNKTVAETVGGLDGGTGRTTVTTYDGLDRPVEVDLTTAENDSRPLPRVLSTTTYDQSGNATTTVDPHGRAVVTVRQTDDFGRLIRVESPDMGSVTFGYDEAGELVNKGNADGTVTTRDYDSFGRVRHVTYPPPAEADGGIPGFTITYTYDDPGTPADLTDCATGSEVSWQSPRNTTGQLANVVDGSRTTWLSYDLAGRTTQRVEEGLWCGVGLGHHVKDGATANCIAQACRHPNFLNTKSCECSK